MLDKLKQIPLKVLFSALFLITMLLTVVVLHPTFTLFMFGTALGIYALGITVLNYWIG